MRGRVHSSILDQEILKCIRIHAPNRKYLIGYADAYVQRLAGVINNRMCPPPPVTENKKYNKDWYGDDNKSERKRRMKVIKGLL